VAVHDVTASATGAEDPAPAAQAPPLPRRRRTTWRGLEPLLWLGPATLLILTMVVWPIIEMIRTSLTKVSSTGLSEGFAGLSNYTDLFAEGDLPGVLLRTVVWVIGVVTVTILVSLGLSQLLNASFNQVSLDRMPHIAFNIITNLLSILIKKIDDDGQIGRVVVTNLVEDGLSIFQ
jgi:ABC-type sugar transport system permease subunit